MSHYLKHITEICRRNETGINDVVLGKGIKGEACVDIA